MFAFGIIIVAVVCCVLFKEEELSLPIISGVLCLTPVIALAASLLFNTLNLQRLFEMISFVIFSSYVFFIIAAIIGVIYLVKQIAVAVQEGKEQISVSGIVLSSVSVLLASIMGAVVMIMLWRGL